jgi:hypothetical protein
MNTARGYNGLIMTKLIRWMLPVALVGAAALSPAQSGQAWAGPELGVFFPTSGKLREALGNSWISFGAGTLRTSQTSERRRLALDWETVSQSKSGSKVFMGAVSYGYVIPLGDAGETFGIQRGQSNFQPYAALRAGASYIDFAVNTNGGRESGKRLGLNANAELGVLVGDRLRVAARYDIFPSHNGLNFSGLTLSARYGLFRF